MNFQTKIKIFSLAFILVVGIDQLSKLAAYQLLELGQSSSYLYDFFRIGLIFNHGVFLGLGNDMPEALRFIIFTLSVPVLLIVFTVYVFRSNEFVGASFIAISAVIAGGFSNVLDRLYNNGGVIDFLNVGIGGLRTGIFNIADMAVLFGVLFLFYLQLRAAKQVES